MKTKAYLLIIVYLFSMGCTRKTQDTNGENSGPCGVEQPEWTKNAVIYEVNIRHHTPEGTINAFAQDLPRLKELGVDIIWLMPVFPVGELNRKAGQSLLVQEIDDPLERKKYLGSPYSTKDYYSVNPDMGTKEDLKDLVDKVHKLGMYVILDIAANHTAWDHEWVDTHPEYYIQLAQGSNPWNKEWMMEHPEFYKRIIELGMTYPIAEGETDWWDTAELDYANKDLRKAMIEVFRYWISEYNIDGYRCDMAGKVPADFWNELRYTLDQGKSIFMLAEDEENEKLLASAFNMNYDWKLHHLMNRIAKGEDNADSLKIFFKQKDTLYSKDCYRMRFITNHDENAWKGSEFERMGEAVEVMALLTFTLPGMPLLYTGQEKGMSKRLKFFEKDFAEGSFDGWEDKYRSFIQLKKSNESLWNGGYGGSMEIIESDSEDVFAFSREAGENKLFVIANLSEREINFELNLKSQNFTNYFTGEVVKLANSIHLGSYQYWVLTENQ